MRAMERLPALKFPSGSLSLPRIFMVTGLSSLVLPKFGFATGASFTEFTTMVTLAVSHSEGVPLSHTR